jgi:hypothetical protein
LRVGNPFADVEKGQPPVIRTASFPYPGNVSVETRQGPKRLGDVILSMALWLEIEQITLEAARRVGVEPKLEWTYACKYVLSLQLTYTRIARCIPLHSVQRQGDRKESNLGTLLETLLRRLL